MAHYYLYNYPRSDAVLSTVFNITSRYCRGIHLWRWIEIIHNLKELKIRWDPVLDDPNSEIFAISVDGTNKMTYEKKHELLNKDPSMFDNKHNCAGWKWEVALSVFRPQVVWVSGPHKASKHDKTIWREGLKYRLADGKVAIVDRGYETSQPDERDKVSTPNSLDSEELANFKTRARLRHETFNGRLCDFKILYNKFRHSEDKQKLAFYAVCVTVQYQMDNGSPIFDV